jgi:hypothetical protein
VVIDPKIKTSLKYRGVTSSLQHYPHHLPTAVWIINEGEALQMWRASRNWHQFGVAAPSLQSAGTSADQLGPCPSRPKASGLDGQLTAFSYTLYPFLGPKFLCENFVLLPSPSLPGLHFLSLGHQKFPDPLEIPLISSSRTTVNSVSWQTLSSSTLPQQQAQAELVSCAPTVQPVRIEEDSVDIFLQPGSYSIFYSRLSNIYWAHQFHPEFWQNTETKLWAWTFRLLHYRLRKFQKFYSRAFQSSSTIILNYIHYWLPMWMLLFWSMLYLYCNHHNNFPILLRNK